jgi:hypothetical protein
MDKITSPARIGYDDNLVHWSRALDRAESFLEGVARACPTPGRRP